MNVNVSHGHHIRSFLVISLVRGSRPGSFPFVVKYSSSYKVHTINIHMPLVYRSTARSALPTRPLSAL